MFIMSLLPIAMYQCSYFKMLGFITCSVLLILITRAQSQTTRDYTSNNGTTTISISEYTSTLLDPFIFTNSEHLLVWSVVEFGRSDDEPSRSSIRAGSINTSSGLITNVSTFFVGEEYSEFWTLAPDYPRRRLFYSDYLLNYFGVYNVEDGSHRKMFDGLSYGIDGIAVDWISGNIYWTDIDIHWIMVADQSLEYFTALIQIDSYSPSKIVVQPSRNLLIWTEVKRHSTEIYKSDLAGSNVTLLHNLTDTLLIDDLVVDESSNRLYWTDRSSFVIFTRARVRSIDLSSPQQIVSHYHAIYDYFDGLTSVGDWLYFISYASQTIMSYNKQTNKATTVVRHLTDTDMRDVTVYSSVVQSSASQLQQAHPCYAHMCDHICLVNATNSAVCICANGYMLEEDERSCGIRILDDNFILGLDVAHEKIYQISLSDSNGFYALPISNAGTVLSIDYDPASKMVYWADPEEDVIKRSYLNGSSQEIFLSGISPFSIAIDTSSRNLYVVDSFGDSIKVSSLDLPNVTSTLHVENVYQVWKIVISPNLRKIFWTDWGPSLSVGLVESINLDGSGRQIISNETQLPYALAIDEQSSTLYWSEDSDIVWYNLNSNHRGRYHSALRDEMGSSFISGLFVHLGYLYTVDLFQPTIHKVPTQTVVMNLINNGSDFERIGPTYFYALSEIHVFSSSTSSSSTTPCARNRGSCPEICLPKTDAFETLCVCQDHSNYVNANNTCVEILDPGDDIPPSFGDTCPESRQMRLGECSETVHFNFTPPVATDNSGKVVVKKYFHGNPPFLLSPGVHLYSYRAQDTNGNRAWCRFTATVYNILTCSESIILPNDTVEGQRSCQSRFGSRVNVTCTRNNRKIMEFQCGIDGNWELQAGPVSCSEKLNKTVTYSQISALSSGEVAGIVCATIIGIAALLIFVILSKKYCRMPYFKQSPSFAYIDRVNMKDGLKNIGSTITGAIGTTEENPYTTIK